MTYVLFWFVAGILFFVLILYTNPKTVMGDFRARPLFCVLVTTHLVILWPYFALVHVKLLLAEKKHGR
jgi:hypothetical protein